MAEMTRERLVTMSDDELLAYEREKHGDPYMSLGVAKEMRKIALKFRHHIRRGTHSDGQSASQEPAQRALAPGRGGRSIVNA